jgi:drug/metabolite transporter (DMT)-like permease
VAGRGLRFDFAPWGWLPIIGLALFASVLATVMNYSGMTRVGPTVASIIGTLEIPLGVLLATLLLGERLGPVQIVGGALVVTAVVLLQLRRMSTRKTADAEQSARGNEETASPIPIP